VEPVAQQRVYELRAAPFRELHTWLESYRELWDARFDELAVVLEELAARDRREQTPRKPKEKKNARRNQ